MRIAMVGSGYVGLVSGVCFADFGHNVVCVDSDAEKIAALKRGECPIFEPGIDDLMERNVREGRLAFATELGACVPQAQAVFIAVGTPSRRGDGHADLSYVYAAARVANPEFLREGAAIQDFKHPDRIVVGTEEKRARQVMAEIYRPLYLNRAPILYTSRRSAELIKYASNAFMATKVGFINEMADLAEEVGADIQDVARGMGLDNRIGSKFLHAGPGFGGSCFPKDARALLQTAHDHDVPLRIVEAVIAGNDIRKRAMARKVSAACGGSLRGKTIAVLGLTFKPNTDDMREAASIPLITALRDMSACVRAFDPAGMGQAKPLLPELVYCDGPYACAEDAHAVVLVTEWEQFRALDLAEMKRRMASPLLIDLRNIYARADVERHGFHYFAVGRPAPVQTQVECTPKMRHENNEEQ